jgi:excisionase family DNA binding protein
MATWGRVLAPMNVIETLRTTTGYIGVREAAGYLGVRKETLLDWIRANTFPIPVTQIGNALKFDRADLDDYLEARRREPVPSRRSQ